jgi:hypothetical protein
MTITTRNQKSMSNEALKKYSKALKVREMTCISFMKLF